MSIDRAGGRVQRRGSEKSHRKGIHPDQFRQITITNRNGGISGLPYNEYVIYRTKYIVIMVKRMISRLSVLGVLIVFMAACSKKAEYIHVIPADASAVASVNLNTLADKAGLNDKENEGVKQKMMEALKSGMNAAAFQQLEKIMKDPSQSGIDIKAPVFVFTSKTFITPAMVAKVSNIDDLRASLDLMAKEGICQPIAEEDGYSFTTLQKNSLLVFNENAAVLTEAYGTSQMDVAKQTISTLLKQTEENSIMKNSGFKKMQNQKGDINFFASMDAVPKIYSQQISMGLSSQLDLSEVMAVGNLNFEKGKIALQIETYSDNAETDALLKKQAQAVKKLNTTFLQNFPESTLAFLNIGVNGAAFYDLLLNNEEFRRNVSLAKAEEVKSLFASFDGDISIGLINVTMNSAPTFAAYADAKNGNALKALYDKKKELKLGRNEDIIQLGENEYVYKSNTNNVFFGIRNKQMYATNDELLYKNISKPVDKSIKDAGYVSDMKGKNVFFVINMDAILDLPVVKMITGFGGEEYQTYYKLASQISYIEAFSDSEGKTETAILLKNKDVNALKQIVDFAKQFAGM